MDGHRERELQAREVECVEDFHAAPSLLLCATSGPGSLPKGKRAADDPISSILGRTTSASRELLFLQLAWATSAEVACPPAGAGSERKTRTGVDLYEGVPLSLSR